MHMTKRYQDQFKKKKFGLHPPLPNKKKLNKQLNTHLNNQLDRQLNRQLDIQMDLPFDDDVTDISSLIVHQPEPINQFEYCQKENYQSPKEEYLETIPNINPNNCTYTASNYPTYNPTYNNNVPLCDDTYTTPSFNTPPSINPPIVNCKSTSINIPSTEKSTPNHNNRNINRDQSALGKNNHYSCNSKTISLEQDCVYDVAYFIRVLKELPGFLEEFEREYTHKYRKYKNAVTEHNLQQKHTKNIIENITKCHTEISHLESENCEMKHKQIQLMHELDTLRLYKSEIDPYVSALKTEQTNRQTENEKLKEENTKLHREINSIKLEHQNTLHLKNQQISHLNSKLGEITHLKNQIDQSTQCINNLRDSLYSPCIKSVYTENKQLRETLCTIQSEISLLKNILPNINFMHLKRDMILTHSLHKQTIHNLSLTNSNLSTHLSKFQSQLPDLSNYFHSLQSQFSSVFDEFSSIRNSFSSTTFYKHLHHQLSKQRKQFDSQKKTLEETNRTLRAQKKIYEKRIKELEKPADGTIVFR